MRPVHGWRGTTETRTSSLVSQTQQGTVAILRRAWEWFGFLHQSHVSDHPIGFPPLPPPLVPPPSTPPPFDRAFLPVWPSTRHLWPSPRCLRTGWGLGECGGPYLQRGWWPLEYNVLLRDLDFHAPIAADGCRLEVAVDGLPLFGGAQLAVDTTLVSAFHCDGTTRRGAAHNEGISMAEQGTEISRTCWASCQISSGGSGC